MTDRRSGPPLFDLMRERGEDPNSPNSPQPNSGQVPAHSPAPTQSSQNQSSTPAQPARAPQSQSSPNGPEVSTRQAAWDTSGGVSRAERSAAAAMLDEPATQESGIRIPMSRVYLAIVVILTAIVGAWAVGYQLGVKEGKKQIEPYIRDQPVVPPSQSNPNTNPSNNGADGTDLQSPFNSTPDPVVRETQIDPRTAILHAQGALARDPREPMLNYLVLAELSRDQALDSIDYMDQRGVEIIAVPVLDSRSSSANNPSRYKLYSLGLAIPGNRWSAMSVERNQHQTQISNLGVRWQRERRGGSDFTQAFWEKYEP